MRWPDGERRSDDARDEGRKVAGIELCLRFEAVLHIKTVSPLQVCQSSYMTTSVSLQQEERRRKEDKQR